MCCNNRGFDSSFLLIIIILFAFMGNGSFLGFGCNNGCNNGCC